MILRDSYDLFPGHCRLCMGNATPVIDTQRPYDVDGVDGVLSVCCDCVSNMAQLLGWVSPQKAEEYDQLLASAKTQLEAFDTEVRDLREFREMVLKDIPKAGARRRKVSA